MDTGNHGSLEIQLPQNVHVVFAWLLKIAESGGNAAKSGWPCHDANHS